MTSKITSKVTSKITSKVTSKINNQALPIYHREITSKETKNLNHWDFSCH